MPKLGKFYNVQLAFDCHDELREQLVALSYLRGYKGRYAPIARDIMTLAVDRYVAELEPVERKQFAEILKNIQAVTVVEKMKREEQLHERLKKREQAAADPH